MSTIRDFTKQQPSGLGTPSSPTAGLTKLNLEEAECYVQSHRQEVGAWVKTSICVSFQSSVTALAQLSTLRQIFSSPATNGGRFLMEWRQQRSLQILSGGVLNVIRLRLSLGS